MAEIVFALLLAAGLATAAGKIFTFSFLTLGILFLETSAMIGVISYKNTGIWCLLSKEGETPSKFRFAGFGVLSSVALCGLLYLIRNFPIAVFFILWFSICCKDAISKFIKERAGRLKKEYQKKAKEYELKQAEQLEAELEAELEDEINDAASEVA